MSEPKQEKQQTKGTTRENAAIIFRAKLKEKKDDFDKVSKKLLNYETRTLVDKSKLPGFRAELMTVYNGLILLIQPNYNLFNDASKTNLAEYIKEFRSKTKRCCDALKFIVTFPQNILELLDQASIVFDSQEEDGASSSKAQEEIREIDESLVENISMIDSDDNEDIEIQAEDPLNNINNINNNVRIDNIMALTQAAKDYYRLANQIVDTKFLGEPSELATFIDQIDLLDSLTEEAQKDTLIRFLVTRMGGRARDALPDNINSVEDIKTSLKTHIKPDSSQVIEGKILALHIDKTNMTKFAEKAEKLAEELKRSLVIEGFSKEKALELTIRKTVEMCRKNSKNETVKAVLSASTYKNPSEVISAMLVQQNIVKEEQKINNKSNNNFDKNKNSNYINNKRGNFRGRGGYRNNDNQYKNNQNNGDNNYKNNNNRKNGRGGYQNNRGGYQNNNNRNEHTVRIVSGNDQTPQYGGAGPNGTNTMSTPMPGTSQQFYQ